jgi:hypothetical protein
MSHLDDQTRIYINWRSLRPRSVRGWLSALGLLVAFMLAVVVVAAIASTLLLVALVVTAVSGAWWFVSRLLGRRNRGLVPYRENQDA